MSLEDLDKEGLSLTEEEANKIKVNSEGVEGRRGGEGGAGRPPV